MIERPALMVLKILFTIGIIVEAITGAMAAGRKKVDVFGVLLIACVTALGGGTVRDIIINSHPLIWVSHPFYLIVAAIAAITTIVFAPSILKIMRAFLILDALGLATFVILGTQKAIDLKLPLSICLISGMLTGISGGMLRDILCNDIPLVLRKEIYALAALIGALFYWCLNAVGLPPTIVVASSLTLIFSIRVYAIINHVEMPVLDYSDPSKKHISKHKQP
jgi:uncharacterized membrane protein YeiH